MREKFEAAMREWVRHPPFTKWEADMRESDHESPTRRHYKLYYNAVCGGFRNPYVLLDVVEEECGISDEYTARKAIDCSFLSLEGTAVTVFTPVADALLGDKLTAFAPNTTGVRFNNPRLLEDSSHQVFKQLFAIAQLFDVMLDYATVRKTYLDVVQREAQYKAIHNVPESVLQDTLKTAFDICTFDIRKNRLPQKYEDCIRGGIMKMASDLINGASFSITEAKVAAGKAALLSAHLLAKQERLIKFAPSQELYATLKCNRFQGSLGILDRLKSNAETYWRWYEIVRLLPNFKQIVL